VLPDATTTTLTLTGAVADYDFKIRSEISGETLSVPFAPAAVSFLFGFNVWSASAQHVQAMREHAQAAPCCLLSSTALCCLMSAAQILVEAGALGNAGIVVVTVSGPHVHNCSFISWTCCGAALWERCTNVHSYCRVATPARCHQLPAPRQPSPKPWTAVRCAVITHPQDGRDCTQITDTAA
jgi:hypothetical protein